MNGNPVLPGERFIASAPGIYTASAIEWFGLESKQGGSVAISAPGTIRVLKSKPNDFQWTAYRWIVRGTPTSEAAALKAPSATRETLHRVDGVIATAGYEDGKIKSSLFDLNKDGKAIRCCF